MKTDVGGSDLALSDWEKIPMQLSYKFTFKQNWTIS